MQTRGYLASLCLAFVACVFASMTAIPSFAQSETVLYNFVGTGNFSVPNLVSDSSGNLYGAIPNNDTKIAQVFELSPAAGGGWTRTVLHNLAPAENAYEIVSNVIFDTAGNLYGTTSEGGAGCGTVYELQPGSGGTWSAKQLHSFSNNSIDGCTPLAGLVIDAAGNLYGTTQMGGHHGTGHCLQTTPDRLDRGAKRSCTSSATTSMASILKPSSLWILPATFMARRTLAVRLRPATGPCSNCRLMPARSRTRRSCTTSRRQTEQMVHPWAESSLMQREDLYGTTDYGGADGFGTAYQLSPVVGGGWTLTLLPIVTATPETGHFPGKLSSRCDWQPVRDNLRWRRWVLWNGLQIEVLGKRVERNHFVFLRRYGRARAGFRTNTGWHG